MSGRSTLGETVSTSRAMTQEGRCPTPLPCSLAARKATFLLALIFIGPPVAGLATRLRTWRIPNPVRRILLPFLICLVVNVTRSPSIASAV